MKQMALLPELRDFLRKHGVIYTVRGYNLMALIYVEVVGVGRCRRVPLGKVLRLEDLKPYVEQSGFSSLKDWRAKIAEFIEPGREVWLYRIEVE